MYIFFNPNPRNQRVGDCVIRAISKATGKEWETTYIEIACEGLKYYDMPSSNYVWGMYLQRHGFRQYSIPNICPSCTTVKEFSDKHKRGTYVLGCQNHVVCSIDGNFFDSWDSSEEIVYFYWQKEE